MQTKLIKPSYLVSLKSTISGGIRYNRVDLDNDREGVTEIARWETTRVIDDKEEHERATKVRGKAVSLIRGVCHPTSFGLICPLNKNDEFNDAVKDARELVDEFNRYAKSCQVYIYILKGEIAGSDAEAVKALSSEVYTLIKEMEEGIDKLDVNEIRAVANKARLVVGTLGDDQSKMLSDAIKEARKAARTIVKRVETAGENASNVLADIRRNDLEKARVAFLDYTEETSEEFTHVPAINTQRFADLDTDEEIQDAV